jgi:NAD(P)-dependent dehydrogenase (short-subunit alcohol dehydrogenase family)
MNLSQKVVVVTGAANGIGLAVCEAMVASGARVAMLDVDATGVEDRGARVGAAMWRSMDVADPAAFRSALDGVESVLGPLDVLVNNAGIMPLGAAVREPDSVTSRILDINVLGLMVGTKRALETMLPRGSGHIVNVASMAGAAPVAGAAAYSASKAAVLGFTDAVRLEVRGSGVTCGVVLPGFVDTRLIAGTAPSRLLRPVTAVAVAEAVVASVARPRAQVFVPRHLGALLRLHQVMPRRASEAFGRALGADSLFLDRVDDDLRRSYEQIVREP